MSNERLFRAWRPGDRKKNWRKQGLANDAFTSAQAGAAARRCGAASKLQLLVGGGVAEVCGADVRLTLRREAQLDTVVALAGRGALEICHAVNGARCLTDRWARVLVDGVLIEVVLNHGLELPPNPV